MSWPRLGVGTAAILLGVAGCNPLNPFDPDIRSGSFLCERRDGSRCPEGQRCEAGRCVSGPVQPDASRADAALPPDGAEIKGTVHLDGAVFGDAGNCADSNREPNNSSTGATFLTSLGNYAFEICYPGDVDHVSILVPAGERLRATIRFTHAEGDLDAALLDPDGATIDESKTYEDTEVLQMGFDAPVNGRYIVGVVGFAGAVGRYTLELEFE